MKPLISQATKMIIALIAFGALCLSIACSTQKHAIPEEGLTLPELYRQAIRGNGNEFSDETHTNEDMLSILKEDNLSLEPNYVGYTRTANNEINNLFKPLPNPSVPIYIYPHLTQIGEDMIPVPGYTSSFFLYKQNRYATVSEKY